MSLEESLAKLREASAKRIPEEKRAILGGFVKDLKESGVVKNAIKVGESLPPFSLKNAYGNEVNSSDLLAKGNIVLTVFRGHW